MCHNRTVWLFWSFSCLKGGFDAENWSCKPSEPTKQGVACAAALAARVVVPPGEKREVVFSLAWDSPEIKFLNGKSYHRRYTTFYGTAGDAASRLAHDAIRDYRKWEIAIEDWQQPILKDEKLPEWYRVTLFNELYYLVAGGTVWTDGSPALQGRSELSSGSSPLTSVPGSPYHEALDTTANSVDSVPLPIDDGEVSSMQSKSVAQDLPPVLEQSAETDVGHNGVAPADLNPFLQGLEDDEVKFISEIEHIKGFPTSESLLSFRNKAELELAASESAEQPESEGNTDVPITKGTLENLILKKMEAAMSHKSHDNSAGHTLGIALLNGEENVGQFSVSGEMVVDNGVARIFQNFMERVMAMEDQTKLGSQMLGVYQQELGLSVDNALKGLHDHIQKEHAIMEDICRLLDEANRIMHDELTAQLENVLVTESEECSSAAKVQQLSSPDYLTTMAAIFGMLQQDYMMQEKVVNTLGLDTSLEVLQNYVMMWTLRPFVDDSVIEKALSWTQHTY